jgi:hypothetical protein
VPQLRTKPRGVARTRLVNLLAPRKIRNTERRAQAKVDLNHGASRIWNGETFGGTTILYAAKDDDSFALQCSYEVETLMERHPQEVRAFRESCRRAGSKAKKLPENRIRDELVVIFGPDMDAKHAVGTLRNLADKIEKSGLMTGRDEADDYIIEMVDGKRST